MIAMTLPLVVMKRKTGTGIGTRIMGMVVSHWRIQTLNKYNNINKKTISNPIERTIVRKLAIPRMSTLVRVVIRVEMDQNERRSIMDYF